eukprot:TRINITY_DN5023_c0_g1_i2.p1 TRINITY_DN5023_c0_g1~~TRINITY_DN5023_c0_g1_i2.p1  ORF type:complete len:191 (+),score=24.54 TRINITY_DN5023_c0_g1_i2:29-601(+)
MHVFAFCLLLVSAYAQCTDPTFKEFNKCATSNSDYCNCFEGFKSDCLSEVPYTNCDWVDSCERKQSCVAPTQECIANVRGDFTNWAICDCISEFDACINTTCGVGDFWKVNNFKLEYRCNEPGSLGRSYYGAQKSVWDSWFNQNIKDFSYDTFWDEEVSFARENEKRRVLGPAPIMIPIREFEILSIPFR